MLCGMTWLSGLALGLPLLFGTGCLSQRSVPESICDAAVVCALVYMRDAAVACA